jgi:hypothetical protein
MTSPKQWADPGLFAFGIALAVVGAAWLRMAWEYFHDRNTTAPRRWYTRDRDPDPLPLLVDDDWDLCILNRDFAETTTQPVEWAEIESPTDPGILE